jgi:hypothetical protein
MNVTRLYVFDSALWAPTVGSIHLGFGQMQETCSHFMITF